MSFAKFNSSLLSIFSIVLISDWRQSSTSIGMIGPSSRGKLLYLTILPFMIATAGIKTEVNAVMISVPDKEEQDEF